MIILIFTDPLGHNLLSRKDLEAQSEFTASLTIDRAKNEGQRAAKNRTTLCPVDGRRVALGSHSC